jgi:hypothetical protein
MTIPQRSKQTTKKNTLRTNRIKKTNISQQNHKKKQIINNINLIKSNPKQPHIVI